MAAGANETAAKIDELKELAPDWDSYGADAPRLSAREDAKRLVYDLARTLGRQFVPPVVGPTPDGGVVLIWRRAGRPKLEVFISPYEPPHYAVLQDRRLVDKGPLKEPAAILPILIRHYAAAL
jgi:hypothetical protein